MQELRCLFALMMGSTRRFVDPSAAVELLRDAFRTSEAQQVRHTSELRLKGPPPECTSGNTSELTCWTFQYAGVHDLERSLEFIRSLLSNFCFSLALL